MKIRIKQLEAIPIRIPLARTFSIASGALTHGNHVMIRATDDEGHVGWGETTTWHKVYGYDQRSIFNVLNDHLIPAVTEFDAMDWPALHRCMDETIPFNQMAKCGIDLAVMDLVGQVLNRPMHDLIGGHRTNVIALIGIVGIVPPRDAAELAEQLVRNGFKTIKVKIGLDPGEDLERLSAIRSAIGSSVRLRVDANQGYDRITAAEILPRLERFKLEWIEQPLAAWDLLGSAQLADRLDTPIALDESALTLHDVQRIIDMAAADVINIKLQKCGGIYPSQQIVATCESAGIHCFLGGCLELSAGSAAMAHFYASTSNLISAVETIPGSYIDDISSSPLTVSNGDLRLPQGPGLGVTIDTAKLEKFRVGNH